MNPLANKIIVKLAGIGYTNMSGSPLAKDIQLATDRAVKDVAEEIRKKIKTGTHEHGVEYLTGYLDAMTDVLALIGEEKIVEPKATETLEDKIDAIPFSANNAKPQIDKAIQELIDQVNALTLNGKYEEYFEVRRDFARDVIALIKSDRSDG